MNVPDNLKYTKDHEWLRIEGEFAFEGLTDFAQSQLADIVTFEVKPVGSKFNKNDIFGSVEAVKAVADLYMGIGGEIVEINDKILNAPELVNKDPYGEGWIVKFKIDKVEEIDSLLSPDNYKRFLEQEEH